MRRGVRQKQFRALYALQPSLIHCSLRRRCLRRRRQCNLCAEFEFQFGALSFNVLSTQINLQILLVEFVHLPDIHRFDHIRIFILQIGRNERHIKMIHAQPFQYLGDIVLFNRTGTLRLRTHKIRLLQNPTHFLRQLNGTQLRVVCFLDTRLQSFRHIAMNDISHALFLSRVQPRQSLLNLVECLLRQSLLLFLACRLRLTQGLLRLLIRLVRQVVHVLLRGRNAEEVVHVLAEDGVQLVDLASLVRIRIAMIATTIVVDHEIIFIRPGCGACCGSCVGMGSTCT
mmetsp:Transcript_33816/g.55152  ORF Transcript_33816/g.55152 Transcript_33816/m.55152 type:complete len:285 (-) Transcript_33816:1342-2196(-)